MFSFDITTFITLFFGLTCPLAVMDLDLVLLAILITLPLGIYASALQLVCFVGLLALVVLFVSGFLKSRCEPEVPAPVSPPPSTVDDSVRVDPEALRLLNKERAQLHLKVKELERSNTSLRSRIWFLEDTAVALRADIRQRAADHNELAKEADASAAARDAAAKECKRLVEENTRLRSEKDILQASKDTLVDDCDELQAELDDVIVGRDALLGEKMAAEERLTREVAKTRKAQAETKLLREQIMMLEGQLATKQETMQDLMDESQALADHLENARRDLQNTQHEVNRLRVSNSELWEANGALEVEVGALRTSSQIVQGARAAHEATLVKTLKERDAEIEQFKVALAVRDAEIAQLKEAFAVRDAEVAQLKEVLTARDAEDSMRVAELHTYIQGLEGVVEFLKLNARSPGPLTSPARKLSSEAGPDTPTKRSSSSAPGTRSLMPETPVKMAAAAPTTSTPPSSGPMMLPRWDSTASVTGSPRWGWWS
ncbi:hypothetical protein C8Q76DRAFT_805652 [Earliella scabrosa]|nr:hypothetical protein C8Q76DRAFT_805652 [Earliella scabrosa]